MAGVNIHASPAAITAGGIINLTASPEVLDTTVRRCTYRWRVAAGVVRPQESESGTAQWHTGGLLPSTYKVFVTLQEFGARGELLHERTGETEVLVTAWTPEAADPPGMHGTTVRQVVRETLETLNGGSSPGPLLHVPPPAPRGVPGSVPVTLQRTNHPPTRDQILWLLIRQGTNSLSYSRYVEFVDRVLFRTEGSDFSAVPEPGGPSPRTSHLRLPYPSVDAYLLLKVATESFVMVNCEGLRDFEKFVKDVDLEEEAGRLGYPVTGPMPQALLDRWNAYRTRLSEDSKPGDDVLVLPYLAIIRRKLPDVPLSPAVDKQLRDGNTDRFVSIIREKLAYPCFLEFIWSYWHEEGMLVQGMNHVSRRFQNLSSPREHDPLENLELDPLRSLNNVLWGYVQDEQHQLSVARRSLEYEHQYGFSLHGKAVARTRGVERRSKFLESFNNLLNQCAQFFRQDDDTTVVADGFAVLNSIKQTHYLLAQGAHNQFGDLPSTARQEMLMQQWILGRPEMREFLGGRVMVPYPEPWMDRVDALKTFYGWTDVSSVHFHDLAVFGEQLLLSIRFGDWSLVNDPHRAANWARYWRPEIQGYIHAYRAVTGVDLTGITTDQQRLAERNLPPSVHLRQRLQQQRRREPDPRG
ncbi:hypothetical protein [Corallococcus exercitus]|uniref:hypothetical protein n=1 Tax=Corallococcus exercitus TaxID=2316736 RepID=UPI0035D4841C